MTVVLLVRVPNSGVILHKRANQRKVSKPFIYLWELFILHTKITNILLIRGNKLGHKHSANILRHKLHWNVVVKCGCCCVYPLPCLWGSPIIPLLVHQPAYPSIWPATPAGSVHKSRGDSAVHMWVLQMAHSGDGCDLALTLCKYDLRKGPGRFVCSELLMCGGGVHSILLLSHNSSSLSVYSLFSCRVGLPPHNALFQDVLMKTGFPS